MCHAVSGTAELAPLLQRASAVALGPGLGRGEWSRALFEAVLAAQRPLVVDADALNLLAETPRAREHWVLTPHPGEAGRLLGCGAAEVEQDRFAALARLRDRYAGVVVLKGAGTLVQGGSRRPPAVCDGGNPGMASGGSGDALTGIIGAWLAQGLEPEVAAELGVCLHAEAGDRAAADGGERGMLASDLIAQLRPLVNPERL
jgi:NAD(P)H-hydrate epimerase